MKKILNIWSIILLMVLLTSIIAITTVTGIEEKEIGLWKYGGIVKLPPKKLYNNVWGATDSEKASGTLTSYIYYKSNGNFGWEWNRPSPIRNSNTGTILPIYPSVVMDKDSSYFPIKLKDINSLTVDLEYRYVKQPTNGYNLAYDIWIIDNRGTASEVMVWLDCARCDPGIYNGEFNDGYNTYKLYKQDADHNRPWPYYAFVLQSRSTSNKVNIKAMFDKLNLNKEWSVTFVNFGNEVWSGSGRVEITKYILNINNAGSVVPITTPITTPVPTPITTPMPGLSENLAPNPDFEYDPLIDYYTRTMMSNTSNVTFLWASDQKYNGFRSLQIIADNVANNKLSRWMSNNTLLNATAGNIYNFGAYIKTDNLNNGSYSDITMTFWDGPPGPDTVVGIFSSESIIDMTDWTQINVGAIAPEGSQYVRLEFRLWGSGTVWFDNATLTNST